MSDLSLFYVRHNHGAPAPIIHESVIGYCDLTVVLEGTLQYRIDGTPLSLSAGDVLLLGKGTLRAREAGTERVDYISFNFYTETPPSLPTVMRGAARSEIKLIIAACDEIVRHDPLGHEKTAAHLLAAMLLVLEGDNSREKVRPLTAKIVRYIGKHFAERITLGDIGKLTYFSPVYCDTVFKKDMGVSIIDYLLTQRVNAAKRLLIEGTSTLSEIARLTGFEDSNYFSRVFKKRTGYTPTAYKKTVLGDLSS